MKINQLFKGKKCLIIPFLAPALVLYLAFAIYPSIRAFYISLHEWTGFTSEMKFVGFANFSELVYDSAFWHSLVNTFIIVGVGGFLIFGLAFLFSGILTSGIKAKRLFRIIIFLPNVIAPVALGVMWAFIYNPRIGLINGFLRTLGLDFLVYPWTGPDFILWAILIAMVWTYVGFYMIVLLAGIDRIPPSFRDAAKVEGANNLQIFIRITIPLLRDVITVAVVWWAITGLKIFEFIYAFSGRDVPQPSWTVAVYMYVMGFGMERGIFRLGYATAIAVALFLLVIISVAIIRRFVRRETIQY